MTSPMPPADLDARYGRRSASGRRVAVIAAAAALLVAGLAWLVWAQPWTAQTFWKPTGYEVLDDRTIAVHFSVTLGDGERAACAIAAENVVHAFVGWRIVEVVGTDVPTQQIRELLRTTETADKGLVYRCWLT